MSKVVALGIAVFALLAQPAFGASMDNIDRSWRARGLQALDKIETLGKKNGDSRGKNLSSKETCQWSLENAFLAFANPSLTDIVIKTENTFRIYGLLITTAGDDFTQVNFVYNKKTGVFSNASVVKLANDWRVMMLPEQLEGGNTFALKTDKCTFLIFLSDPLNSSVISD